MAIRHDIVQLALDTLRPEMSPNQLLDWCLNRLDKKEAEETQTEIRRQWVRQEIIRQTRRFNVEVPLITWAGDPLSQLLTSLLTFRDDPGQTGMMTAADWVLAFSKQFLPSDMVYYIAELFGGRFVLEPDVDNCVEYREPMFKLSVYRLSDGSFVYDSTGEGDYDTADDLAQLLNDTNYTIESLDLEDDEIEPFSNEDG